MQDKYGLRVVKYLFAGRESAYTYPDVIEIMKVAILLSALCQSLLYFNRKATATKIARRRWESAGPNFSKASRQLS